MKRLSIPLGILLGLAGSSQAAFTPIPLDPGSFNQDVVVDRNGPAPVIPGGATTASMDGGIGNNGDTWNEQGYFSQDAAVGLPAAGSTIQALCDATNTPASSHRFTFAPSYTANNAILLDVGYFTNADFKLTTPAAYKALSFLTSGGNGGAVFQYTLQHQDGSREVGVTNSADWFNVTASLAYIANGRVNAQSFTLDNYNSQNPRLYAIDVNLSGSTSPVTNINIKYTGGNASGHSCIMAISGTPTSGSTGTFNPILGTGYTADIVVEANAAKRWDTEVYPSEPTITATIDGGPTLDANGHYTGATWFEQGYYTRSNTFGLPVGGTTFTSASLPDHQYTMPVGPGILLDGLILSDTITFTTPAAFTALSLLGSSGGGNGNIQVTVNFSDSSTEVHNIVVPDWFNGANPAWTANGRVNGGSGIFDSLNSGNPRLYSIDIPISNITKPIASLALSWVSGGRAALFAVSGAAGALPPLFTVQPASAVVNPGASTNLTASASSSISFTYQWQKGTNGVFVDVTGQTTETLNFPSVTEADDADYRVIAANTAGRATSAVATLTVYTSLPRITVPSDPVVAYQPNGGSSPGGEAVQHVIDGAVGKYLNFGNGSTPIPPLGFIVNPSAGRTFVKAIRFYTANDAPERDPANYIIEGSNDNGTTWSLIASNSLSLPDGRNTQAGTTPIDPTTQFNRQVRIYNNNVSYGAYRVYFTVLKQNVNLMQIGEVELLGTVDNAGYPAFTAEPTNTMVFVNTEATLYGGATGNPAPTFQWLKNGARITGATQPTLHFASAQFGDAADYQLVIANSLQTITSQVAHLTVLSTLTDVTQPGDPTTEFGDQSGTFWPVLDRNPANAFDNGFQKYQNGGSGFSAAAGFPPFQGPVGVIVTPAAGRTRLSGIRIYAADGNTERDPGDFALYGSNDGTNWSLIAGGALNLPSGRNSGATTIAEPFDQTTGAPNSLQEVLFGNDKGYTSYKVQFNHTRNDNAANSLQVGDIELLGGPAVPLSFTPATGGQFQIQWTGQGTLLESTNIAGPWTTNTSSSPVLVTPSGPQKFYKLIVQ